MKDAQQMYRRGLDHLAARRLGEAAKCFEAALAIVRKHRLEPPAKLLSYCGYTLALARRKYGQALSLCRAAAEKEFFNPDIFYNLGEVHLARGERGRAHETFCRGLALNPSHVSIRKRLKRMGVRQSPPIGFLARHNIFNRMLGRALRPRA